MKKIIWFCLFCGGVCHYSLLFAAERTTAAKAEEFRAVIAMQLFMKITAADRTEATVAIRPCVAYTGDTQIRPLPLFQCRVEKGNAVILPWGESEHRKSIASFCFFRRFDTPAGAGWVRLMVRNATAAERFAVEMLYQPDARQYGVIPFVGEVEAGKYQEIYRFYTGDGKKLFLNQAPAAAEVTVPPVLPPLKDAAVAATRHSPLIPYRQGSSWGVATPAGEMVIPCEYPTIIMTSGNVHMLVGEGQYGFILPDGKVDYPVGKCYSLSFGRISGGRGSIILDMKEITARVADYCRKHDAAASPAETTLRLGVTSPPPSPSGGLRSYRDHGRIGFKNDWGNVVIPAKYESGGNFAEGLAAVELNGKWGFVNDSGQTKIPFKFSNAGCFSEGLAAVKLNGKWGFVNRSGHLVIPCRYDWVNDFHHGLAMVSENPGGNNGYIDASGREYWED